MRLRVILQEDPHAEAEQWLAADVRSCAADVRWDKSAVRSPAAVVRVDEVADQRLSADGEPDADKKYLLVAQRWMRRAGTLASALLKEQSWADQPLLAEQNKT